MLDIKAFKHVVENTPLISIDICLVFDGQLLLGKRRNEPLKNEWFTPGGRVFKNERWQDCLKRVAFSELGLSIYDVGAFTLMGVWDHFYPNSIFSDSTSTHYVNLPYYLVVESEVHVKGDDQHAKFEWFDLDRLHNDPNFHDYTRKYAGWLINRMAVSSD